MFIPIPHFDLHWGVLAKSLLSCYRLDWTPSTLAVASSPDTAIHHHLGDFNHFLCVDMEIAKAILNPNPLCVTFR